jgi:hypothetical protein
VIQTGKRPHHVADVSPHTELGHPPDIDGDLHEDDLTTVAPA